MDDNMNKIYIYMFDLSDEWGSKSLKKNFFKTELGLSLLKT